MIIYKDLITDDEMVSDSFDPKPIDDTVYEVDCSMITVGGESFGKVPPFTTAAVGGYCIQPWRLLVGRETCSWRTAACGVQGSCKDRQLSAKQGLSLASSGAKPAACVREGSRG